MIAIIALCSLLSTGALAESLSIDRLQLEVRSTGYLARTTMTLVLKNSSDVWEEAYVDLTLPRNASVTRMSMDVGTGAERPRMEGRIVDRERAASVYQAIVDSVRDPAILEDKGRGSYLLRVFPVPERSHKTIIIHFEHLLPWTRRDGAQYLLKAPALRGEGPNTIRRVSLSVDGQGQGHRHWPENEELAVRVDQPAPPPVAIHYARHQGHTYFRARVVPEVDPPQRHPVHVLLALDRSSANREEMQEKARRLEAELGQQSLVHIVEVDAERALCRFLPCPEPPSALNLLLKTASARAAQLDGPVAIVLMSEGHVEEASWEDLLARAQTMSRLQSLHILGVGSPSRNRLQELARAGGGHFTSDSEQLIGTIREPILRDIRVASSSAELEGLGPDKHSSVPLGQPLTIYGRFQGDEASLVIRYRVDPYDFEERISLRAPPRADRRSVLRGWKRAAAPELASSVGGIRVLTANKALLVLETARDYKKLREAPAARAPIVRIAMARALGALNKNMLRPRVHRARPRIRHCYNLALRRNPQSRGELVVLWTIDPSGRSTDVQVSGTIADEGLKLCVAAVHESLEFPAVESGGYIRVRYPYVFNLP